MRRLIALLVVVMLAGAVPRWAVAERSHGDCDRYVPAATTLDQLATPSTTPTVRLDVLVLTERVDLPAVKSLFAVAARAYAPLGISLVPKYRVTRPVPDLDGAATAYVAWLKKQFKDGRRPKGSDVVYLATHRYIGEAGVADCIGGIAYPDHAFAVGKLDYDGLIGVNVEGGGLPTPPLQDGGAKLAAHEIGHLLGAHHHYGHHCVLAVDPADPTHPCDVMSSVLRQQTGLRFGPVNAAVVRDHALRFARP